MPTHPERVLSVRKLGGGQQYEIKWQGQEETTWEAASRMKRQFPQLVQEFEQQQQQLPSAQQPAPAQPSHKNKEESPVRPFEGETDSADVQMREVVMAPALLQLEGQTAPDSSTRQQMQVLEQLVREQAQQMREQAQQLQMLRASPAHSPQLSAQPSPQLSLLQDARHLAAAASAAAPTASTSRFAKKEPRAQDLGEYDGASGARLDDWLKQLAMAARLYHLNAQEAVDFAGSRLRGAALDWWLSLGDAELAAISDTGALAATLRARFQPVTAARTAREQLDKLQQGGRGVNEYIADFQRLTTQIGMVSLGEENALFAFERGLRRELAVELRKQGVATLKEAIALVARVGGLLQASAGTPQGRGSAANQMDVDDGDGSASRLDRIEAALNALTSGAQGSSGTGMGAKTQTQRGYQQERGVSGRGGGRGGRGGRFGGRGGSSDPPLIPKVPGVPAAIVEQRRAAGQCYRCGSAEHTRFECPNATSVSGN